MREVQRSAGDLIPPGFEIIEVRVTEARQLFNPLDGSPFRSKDLDPVAEDFIVSWVRDMSRKAPPALLIHVGRTAGPTEDPTALRAAIRVFFEMRAMKTRQRLHQLFRTGWRSLLIGLAFLSVLLAGAWAVAGALGPIGLGAILRDALIVGGCLALLRPFQILLYEWWPIRGEVRLFERLSAMPVRVAYREMPAGSTRTG